MTIVQPTSRDDVTPEQRGKDGYVAPPINPATGLLFEVPEDLAAVRADPEGCRQLLWRLGEPCGWPELVAGGVHLHAGAAAWRADLEKLIPTWLLNLDRSLVFALERYEERQNPEFKEEVIQKRYPKRTPHPNV